MEKLAAIVPLPRVHLVRYAGCFAPHSKLRAASIPTPHQQGMGGEDTKTGTPYWHWYRARLLSRVFDVDMGTCLPPLCGRREPCDLPFCRRGSLRIIAAITHAEVIRTMLRHLKRATDPPPIAPARACPAPFAWASPSPDVSSHVPWEQGMAEVRLLRVMRAACGERERV